MKGTGGCADLIARAKNLLESTPSETSQTEIKNLIGDEKYRSFFRDSDETLNSKVATLTSIAESQFVSLHKLCKTKEEENHPDLVESILKAFVKG